MTKKHYIAIADAIREHNRLSLTKFEAAHIDTLAASMARQNPRFNWQRWVSYIDGKCGPNGGEIK